MQKNNLPFIIIILISFFLKACTVSFINSGIDYTLLKTFSIEQFEAKASGAPPTSGQKFSEKLKDKIMNNTRLAYRDEKGDVEFTGYITEYLITALAPQADQTVSFQRLTINVGITLKNNQQKDGSEDWTQSFSRFANFAADQDLSTVENVLIEEIYDQILEDVFNKAFSGW